MVFSEDSRVKIPCILHLVRLGYQYLSLKGATWDEETNIFPDQFRTAMARVNPGIEEGDIGRVLDEIKLLLDNEDLGRAFYERLTARSGIRLIDFEDFNNNSFHIVTELTCKNGDDEFRPDITLLINGMPLAFIEVKKPNNREGVLAERKRIIMRSFLANLIQSDRNAIHVGLTGTPLLGDDSNSRALFGDYIHKYYYNASIADGYTLRLIREEIATNYRLALQEALAAVELQQGDIDRIGHSRANT